MGIVWYLEESRRHRTTRHAISRGHVPHHRARRCSSTLQTHNLPTFITPHENVVTITIIIIDFYWHELIPFLITQFRNFQYHKLELCRDTGSSTNRNSWYPWARPAALFLIWCCGLCVVTVTIPVSSHCEECVRAHASEKEHSVKYQRQRMLTRVKANTHRHIYVCPHACAHTPKLPGFIWPNPDFWFMLIFRSFLAPVKHLMNHTHTPCNTKPVSTSQSAFLWLPDSQSINHSLLHPLLPQRGLSRGKSLKVTANFPPRHLPPLTHSFPPPVSSQA